MVKGFHFCKRIRFLTQVGVAINATVADRNSHGVRFFLVLRSIRMLDVLFRS